MAEGFLQGPAFCPDCGCDWVAVCPVATDTNALECPKCHETIGRLL